MLILPQELTHHQVRYNLLVNLQIRNIAVMERTRVSLCTKIDCHVHCQVTGDYPNGCCPTKNTTMEWQTVLNLLLPGVTAMVLMMAKLGDWHMTAN